MLPPGRVKLATRPVPTGSPAAAKTMGMTDVACLAARIASVADVTMTSTLRRTNSAAISAKRSLRPSAQRYSIVMVRPSIQPSSRRRCTKAAIHWPWDVGVPATRNPIVGGGPACCARAASGHATAPPRAKMNVRRLIRSPRWRGSAAMQEAQCRALGGLEVDDEIELYRPLDWEIGRRSALQNLVHESRRARIEVRKIHSIFHQRGGFRVRLEPDHRTSILQRQLRSLSGVGNE